MDHPDKEPAVRRVFKSLGLEVKPGEELQMLLEVVAANQLYQDSCGKLIVEMWNEVQRLSKEMRQQSVEFEKLTDSVIKRAALSDAEIKKITTAFVTTPFMQSQFKAIDELVNHTSALTNHLARLKPAFRSDAYVEDDTAGDQNCVVLHLNGSTKKYTGDRHD